MKHKNHGKKVAGATRITNAEGRRVWLYNGDQFLSQADIKANNPINKIQIRKEETSNP